MGYGLATSSKNIGAEFLQLFQIAAGAEHEHAAVPVKVPGKQIVFSGIKIRFLYELGHLVAARPFGSAFLHVAIACLGMGRHDPKADQLACFGKGQGGADALAEACFILDEVVGGQDQQHRILPVRHRLQRSKRNCRGGITAHGLEQNLSVFHVQLAHLLGSNETVFLVTDQPGQLDIETFQTLDRGLQHGHRRIGQRQELLGIELARERPEARAGAARHDDGDHFKLLYMIAAVYF